MGTTQKKSMNEWYGPQSLEVPTHRKVDAKVILTTAVMAFIHYHPVPDQAILIWHKNCNYQNYQPIKSWNRVNPDSLVKQRFKTFLIFFSHIIQVGCFSFQFVALQTQKKTW